MSFIIYGSDNSKRLRSGIDIHQVYNNLVNELNNYMLNNYSYTIETYYKG